MIKNVKGCWYFIYTLACPVCGREDVTRERRNGPKPQDLGKIYEYAEQYDWCQN